jgi:hypothetical protein
MEYYVGLDVSLKQTSICIVDHAVSVARGARCDVSVPVEAVQQIPVVMDLGVRRDDWGEF